jgi:transglutaminase-like putative cysteine protease
VRFRLAHKLGTFLLAGTALFTLATSNVLPTLTLVLVGFSFVLSWHADQETRIGQWFDRGATALNIATLLFLAGAVFQVARSFPDVDLLPFLNFVIFLLTLKLCQRRSNRDYLQVYVLSFLIMLAAAWLATSVIFVVGFCVYVLLATWTLVLFHLRREIEENYIVRHASESRTEQVTATRVLNSRRVVGIPFFATTGAVALLVMLGSSFVFAMVPRVGLGFILGGVRRPVGIAGFTDEVKLGMQGTISTDNQTVVLRAQVPAIAAVANESAREATISSLYWRGTVYDTYDRGQWLRSREDRTRTQLTASASPRDLGRTYLLFDPFEIHYPTARRVAVRGAIEQEIEIVALSHPVAFALDRPVAFEMPPPPTGTFTAVDIEARWSDEVSLRMFRVNPANPYDRRQAMTEFLGARYRVYSREGSRGRAEGAHLAREDLPFGTLDNYLRVPESLAANVRTLAREITAGKDTGAAKVEAVVAWLRQTHGYTTNLKRDERIADPLEDFLFAENAGHCEYFASAAAILLRLSGVPTRYVNGFLGGEWNGMRKAITVRENRAHSWIEAYLDKEGWVRVDATPAQSRPARMGSLRQLLDSAELFWGRWVVEYNASQQLLLAQRLGQKFGFHSRGYLPGRGPTQLTKKQALVFTGLVVLGIALWSQRKRLLWWRKRYEVAGARQRSVKPVVRIYHATIARLAAAGMPRLPWETPHEYLARLRESPLEGATIFEDLTDAYTSARYGDIEIPAEAIARLRRETSHIGLAR